MTAGHRLRGGSAALLLMAGHAGVTGLLVWGTAGALAGLRDAATPPVGTAVALAAGVGAWAVLSWLTVATALALAAAAVSGLGSPAHLRAAGLAPAAARRLVGAVVGIVVAGGPLAGALPSAAADRVVVPAAASTATAADRLGAPDPVGTDGVPPDRPAASAPPGWTPDRPAATHRRSAGDDAAVRLVATVPNAEHGVVDEVVVRRGDTLWDIAARHLGSGAGAAEVAAEWPRWYAANRDVIGSDPGLIRPGQRLTAPA